MRIIRHQLEITDYQELELPNQGELLSVAQSRTSPNGHIDLWSLDYEYGRGRTAGIYIAGTGNPMPPELRDDLITEHDPGIPPGTWRKFIGTVVTPIGLVWHVFGGPTCP